MGFTKKPLTAERKGRFEELRFALITTALATKGTKVFFASSAV